MRSKVGPTASTPPFVLDASNQTPTCTATPMRAKTTKVTTARALGCLCHRKQLVPLSNTPSVDTSWTSSSSVALIAPYPIHRGCQGLCPGLGRAMPTRRSMTCKPCQASTATMFQHCHLSSIRVSSTACRSTLLSGGGQARRTAILPRI